ncbi:MAG: hypothetical protein R3B90_05005 [Planctomycetaceae bacterium]
MTRLVLACGLTLMLSLAGCGGDTTTPDAGSENTTGNTTPAGSTDVDLGASSTTAPGTVTTDATGTAPAPAGGASTTTTPPATPNTAGTNPTVVPAAGATAGVDLSMLTSEAALAIVVRPNQAMTNPVVKGVLAEVEAANPDFSLEKSLEEMRNETGVDPSEIDNVLVVFDKQHLEMLPFMAMMFMGGGGMGPGPGAFEEEMMIDEAFPQVEPEDAGNCDDKAAFDDAAAGDDFGPAEGEFAGPFGPQPPPPVVVVKFNRDVDPLKLVNTRGIETEPTAYNGKQYFVKQDGSTAYFADARTAVIASEARVKDLIDGKPAGQSELAAAVAPLAAREFAVALDVRPLHMFLSELASGSNNPMAAIAGGLVKQINTLTLTADLQGPNLLQLNLHTINDGSAAGLQGMLDQLLTGGKQQFAMQMQQGADQMTAGQQSVMPYIKDVVENAAVTAEGNVCSVTVTRPANLEQLPEKLRPALQEMAEQQKTAAKMDPLRQIGIAFHNYHDIYGAMPYNGGPGDSAAPGKAELSACICCRCSKSTSSTSSSTSTSLGTAKPTRLSSSECRRFSARIRKARPRCMCSWVKVSRSV